MILCFLEEDHEAMIKTPSNVKVDLGLCSGLFPVWKCDPLIIFSTVLSSNSKEIEKQGQASVFP